MLRCCTGGGQRCLRICCSWIKIRCGDILFNRMLWMGDDEEENVEIMETKLEIGENELLSLL